ncbi:MAG: choice-of-anchor Q domain-containing protein, partial [Rhodothermia bacterium]
VSDNSTRGTGAEGGGIHVRLASGGSALITSNTASGNSTSRGFGSGMGIFAEVIDGGIVKITSNTVVDNSFPRPPSGFAGIATDTRTGGAAVIADNTVEGNFGGISAHGSGTTEIVRNQIINNTFTGLSLHTSGGGVMRSSDNVVTGNETDFEGGGLLLVARTGGSILVTDTTVAGNVSERFGGGISARVQDGGSVTIAHTTISNNYTRSDGAGMWVSNSNGTLIVEESTFSANSADGFGGGIVAADYGGGGGTTVRHSTITNNTADKDNDGVGSGGGVFVAEEVVTLDHTIVAGNHDNSGAANDVAGILNSNYSLIGFGADFLGPLADNGGLTLTHALLPGSPAIDAGNPSFVSLSDFDQRGAPFSRVFNGRIDIGAVERHTGDMNFDGELDFDDVDALVLGLTDPGGYEVVYGAPPNSNGDTDGEGDLDFDDIPGFVNLLSPGAIALRAENGSFDVIGVKNDLVKLSAETRREAANVTNLPRPNLLPVLNKMVISARLQSASAARELRDDELATVWSDGFDWLHSVDRDRFG